MRIGRSSLAQLVCVLQFGICILSVSSHVLPRDHEHDEFEVPPNRKPIPLITQKPTAATTTRPAPSLSSTTICSTGIGIRVCTQIPVPVQTKTTGGSSVKPSTSVKTALSTGTGRPSAAVPTLGRPTSTGNVGEKEGSAGPAKDATVAPTSLPPPPPPPPVAPLTPPSNPLSNPQTALQRKSSDLTTILAALIGGLGGFSLLFLAFIIFHRRKLQRDSKRESLSEKPLSLFLRDSFVCEEVSERTPLRSRAGPWPMTLEEAKPELEKEGMVEEEQKKALLRAEVYPNRRSSVPTVLKIGISSESRNTEYRRGDYEVVYGPETYWERTRGGHS